MIDNRLKKCCEHCDYLDIKTDEDVLSLLTRIDIVDRLLVTISCGHMNVCKDYIEEAEKEKDRVIHNDKP